MAKRKLEVEILDSHKGTGFRDSERAASGWATKLGGFAKTASLGLAAVGVGAVVLGTKFAKAAEESQQVTRQTAAVIKSMGNVAGISADQVAGLSEKLSLKSGIDDELIQSGQNVLLTFGKVRNEVGKGNDIFNRATVSALDMSVALKTDLSAANIQLGKALNDPIKGITALSRAGVSFTEEQKEQIKTLVESGKTLDAQKIILSELEKQFGGSAEAQATASGKLSVAWGNIQETLGEALLPIFEKVSGWLAGTLPKAIDKAMPVFREITGGIRAFLGTWNHAEDGITSSGFPGFMERFAIVARHSFDAIAKWVRANWPKIRDTIAQAMERIGEVFDNIAGWVRKNWPQISKTITEHVTKIQKVVADVIEIVQTLWRNFGDNIMRFVNEAWPHVANVIGGIMTVIQQSIALVLAIIKGDWGGAWDAIKGIVSGVWQAIKGIIGSFLAQIKAIVGVGLEILGAMFGGAWARIKAGAGAAWGWIQDKIGGVVNWIKKLPGIVGQVGAQMWGGLKSGLANVVNWIIGKINMIIRAYNAVPGVGNVSEIGAGISVGLGRMPSGQNIRRGGSNQQLAEGGIGLARRGGIDVKIAEAGRDEAVIPLPSDWRRNGIAGNGGGNTFIFQFDRPVIANEAEFEKMVTQAANKALQVDPRAITVRGKQLATA